MTAPWPDGIGRIILDEVDSTNRFLQGAGDVAPAWCLAKHQIAGRGRRGRSWVFHPGNFAASLRISPPGEIAQFAQYSFVAALALYDGLNDFTRAGDRLALKWPNDVLLDGRKTCGILLETMAGVFQSDLIVGIGVNLATAPEVSEVERDAMMPGSIRELTGKEIAPEDFLDVLAPAFAGWSDRMQSEGFAPIRDAWRARAAGLGMRITARLPNVTHEGIFEDIDTDGSLVLRTATKRLVLPAADVYFAGSK